MQFLLLIVFLLCRDSKHKRKMQEIRYKDQHINPSLSQKEV